MNFDCVDPPEAVGMAHDKITELDRIIESQVLAGLTPGMQVIIARHGQVVLDKAIGIARCQPLTPVTPQTLFYSWSTVKPITAMCIHLLVERGKLDLDDPIAKHWREFGKHGKDRVTVRHVLAHRGGFPTTPEAINHTDPGNWEAIIRVMEDIHLKWEPDSAIEYHPLNFGWVLAELLRRVDGRPIEIFMRDEFLRPLGMNDSYLKIDGAELSRTVELYAPADFADGVESATAFNRPIMRLAVIPAGGLHTTARDMARFYQMLLNGGELDRVRVLQAETIKRARTPAYKPGERERDNNLPAHKSLGFGLGGYAECMWGGANARISTFGHNGFATNVTFADVERDLICIVLNNGMQPDPVNDKRHRHICNTLWDACSVN